MIRLPTRLAALALPLFLLSAGLLQAQGDPWSATVAVADRGIDEKREAQALALREVLLANSGDKTLLNRDEVRAALRDAETWVERFDYRTPEPGTLIPVGTPLTEQVRETGEATQLMLVSFDREQLGALIAGDVKDESVAEGNGDDEVDPFAQIESALVWLLIEDDRREILVSDPAAVNVRARAREIAGARGVNLRYPAGDDEDRAAVGADDIREVRLERLRQASARYAEPVVLVGQLARDGLDAWRGRWVKFAGELVVEQSFTTGSLDEALQSGLGFLSDSAAGADDSYAYGGEAGSDTEALVWIGSIDGLADYATALNFLSSINGVGTVYPKEIDDRGIVFTVVPRGALPAIAAAADGQDWLRRTTQPSELPDRDQRSTGSVTDLRQGGERFERRERPRVPLARNAELAFDFLR